MTASNGRPLMVAWADPTEKKRNHLTLEMKRTHSAERQFVVVATDKCLLVFVRAINVRHKNLNNVQNVHFVCAKFEYVLSSATSLTDIFDCVDRQIEFRTETERRLLASKRHWKMLRFLLCQSFMKTNDICSNKSSMGFCCISFFSCSRDRDCCHSWDRIERSFGDMSSNHSTKDKVGPTESIRIYILRALRQSTNPSNWFWK